MDEPSEGTNRLIAFILVGAVIIGVWSWWKRSGASESVEQSVGVFVPAPHAFEEQRGHIEETRQLVDMLNAREGADETLR